MKTHISQQQLVQKVPEITVYFWLVKILTTAMGESASDYLVHALNPIIAVGIGGIVFIVALLMQFSARRYIPWVYWFTVAMVAVFGTMAADIVHIGLGVPYLASTIFFTVTLAIIFFFWYASEKTLSIHSINTTRRELFYWSTVLATFALGTAAGDMTAITMGWGYLSSGIVFTMLIIIIALSYYFFKAILGASHRHISRNAVFAFWLAYIMTRPLGASFADWMGKARNVGGLGFGDGYVSLGLTIVIACLVYYLSQNHRDRKNS